MRLPATAALALLWSLCWTAGEWGARRRAVFVALLVPAILSGALIALYHRQVTGDVFRLPYAVYAEQYMRVPLVRGEAGPLPGYLMSRGTILLGGGSRELSPTFVDCGVHELLASSPVTAD